jgi:hypothetical protein
MALAPSKVLTVSITRPFEDVYAFLADFKNFPLWASGIGKIRRQMGSNEWLVDTLDGVPARIRLVPKNDFGVVDHYVLPDDMEEIYVPMRAVRNGDGTDVAFTLFQGEDMSDAQFAKDEKHVRKDLDALKKHLES